MTADIFDPREFLQEHAPWLAAPELGVCIVGSQALELACRQAGLDGPKPVDLDLAWSLDGETGTTLLEQHGVFVPTTPGNQERGTLAAKIGGERIEITTFRAGDASMSQTARIAADLAERDMTIGAIAFELATGRMHDPHDGLQHFRERRVVPVGDPTARVQEHAIRWLRYFRKAHELGFEVARPIRALRRNLDPTLLLSLPKEAIALELRAILRKCASPGRCLLDLHEVGLLPTLSPELAAQFDGRPAGPQRWHPEVSQGLHLILTLEWAAQNSRDLDDRDRTAALFAALCHDLGKNDTKRSAFPHHLGHEGAGVPHIEALARRWPGLMDQRTESLARDVAELHLEARRFEDLRSGTLAKQFDRYFRNKDYPIDAFAVAVAADSAGRLGHETDGERIRAGIAHNLRNLRDACRTVDAGTIRQQHPNDLDAFKAALHEARARAIAKRRTEPGYFSSFS